MNDRVFATTLKRVQYLLIVMGEYKFSGVDPIRIISFLARCKENFDNANMTEAMSLTDLNPPSFTARQGDIRFLEGAAPHIPSDCELVCRR